MVIFLTKANHFAFWLTPAIAANYIRHQNQLCQHWTGPAANQAVNHLYE